MQDTGQINHAEMGAIIMKKSIFFGILLCSIFFITGQCQAATDVEQDGLIYRLNQDTGTAVVMDCKDGDSVRREVRIPVSIQVEGKSYKVVEVGRCSFVMVNDIDTVYIPDSVVKISYAAFSSSYIKIIKIGKGVRTLGENPFQFCKKLSKVIIDKKNPYIKMVNGAVYSKDGKTLLSCGVAKGHLVIPKKVKKIQKGAISGTKSISKVSILADIKELPECCFQESHVKKVILPKKLKTIKKDCFHDCVYLKGITLPNTLKRIEERAFYQCQMRELVIPKSVKWIHKNALYSCIERVIFKGKVPPRVKKQEDYIPDEAFEDFDPPIEQIIPGITTVEVPKKYFKKYKKAIGKNINYTYIKGK